MTEQESRKEILKYSLELVRVCKESSINFNIILFFYYKAANKFKNRLCMNRKYRLNFTGL